MDKNSFNESMTVRMFFVVEWILENQFSVIPFRNIVSPVKDVYEVNDEVQARWGRGKSAYPARIVKASDDQGKLSDELTGIIEVELRKKNVTVADESSATSASSIPSQNEDCNLTKTTKPKGKTGPKEKNDKKQKEELEKAANNLELLELALDKSALALGLKTPEKSANLSATPKNLTPSTPRIRRSPRISRLQHSSPYDMPSTSSHVSTSTVLKSAFTTLNSAGPSREFEIDHMNIQQRVAALESWVYSLQQEVNQQRSNISWIYSEQQKQSYSLNASAKQAMEATGNPQNESFNLNATATSTETIGTSGNYQTSERLQSSESSSEQPFTKDQLKGLLSLETDFAKGAKLLFRKLYRNEEMIGRSLTGQRANKQKPSKPALENQEKLAMLYEIVMEKWPFATKAMINSKLADLLKPSAVRK